ncbi:hypothetical protein BGW41_004215 [Actinomortierella wolfii]|nr:hypothetical protein BGW41_004215 [Actinomortierella wolfii]
MPTLAFAQDVILSEALFLGEDTTDPRAHGPRIYLETRNHATAAASVLHYAADWAGYKPSSRPPPKSMAIYGKYEQKVRDFPGFEKVDEFYDHLLLHGGLDDLERQVLSSYEGYGRRFIANGLRNLVPTVNKDLSPKQWILTLPIIIKRYRMEQVTVKLVRLAVHLHTDEDGNVELPGGQVAGFVITELKVLPKVLKDLANDLAAKIEQTSIDEFKTFFTTKLDELDQRCEAKNETDDWLHNENKGQHSLIEHLRRLWHDI